MPTRAASRPKTRPVTARAQQVTSRRPAAAAASRGASPIRRPRGRTHHVPGQEREAPDADNYGVIWLDCCGRPIAEALSGLIELAGELDGELSLLDQAPTYAVALVRLPRESFTRFRGALALAGGSFLDGDNSDPSAETVFIMSHGAASPSFP